MTAKLFFSSFLVISMAACKKGGLTIPATYSAPNAYLSAKSYDKLILEIQYVNGYQPSIATVNNLTSFLQARLNKPGGITVVMEAISSPGKASLSLADVQAIEAAQRTQQTKGSTLTAYYLFADGDYAASTGNGKVLGLTYGPTSVVIFEKTIQSFSGGVGQPQTTVLESTVAEHEFGHLLGLVNNGTPMQSSHQDGGNGAHCNNNTCLMYYSVETSDFVGNLLGGNIPPLDGNCQNDLKANGGK
jgi:hypothetical protein